MTTNHLPARDGQLYICPSCAWRAVLTTNGIYVTQRGDDADHHAGIAQQQQAALAEAERITARLRMQYGDGATLPSGGTLTLRQLQRLYRAVTTEFTI